MNCAFAQSERNTIFAPDLEELVDYMLPMSLSLIELGATTCNSSDKNISFISTYSGKVIGNNYIWEEYRGSNYYKCIKLHFPQIGFLNEKQTRVFLTAHNGHNNKNLGWSVKLLLKYYMYRDRFCDMAHEYKPSQTKGYIKRVNLCGDEYLVQGGFIFQNPITR